MTRIDVDAHVDETDLTWEYLTGSEIAHKPVSVDPGVPTVPGDRRPHRIWMIDGHTRLRRWRDDVRTGTVRATRELSDVPARLRADGRTERRYPGAVPHPVPRRLHGARGGRCRAHRRLQPMDGRGDAVLRRTPALGRAALAARYRERRLRVAVGQRRTARAA